MKLDIDQLEFIDPKLRDLALWIEKETGYEFTATSLYRIADTGVHGALPLRGLDLRCRSNEIGLAVEAFINRSWKYDPKRDWIRCCLIHGEGSNLHLHLQVHPNTEFVGKK